MEELKLIERSLMGEEEFKDYLKSNGKDYTKDLVDNGVLNLRYFNAVGYVKSIRRSIKRGHVSIDGSIFPRRPYNNRANTSKRKDIHSRTFNLERRRIYEYIKCKIAAK